MSARKSSTIEHPVCGKLKVDRYGTWSGVIPLPLFAQYDDDESRSLDEQDERHSQPTKRQARRAAQFANGLFTLRFDGDDDSVPTAAQEQAYRFLVTHERDVVDAVMTHVFRTYVNRYDFWTLDGLQKQDDEFDLKSPDDLKNLMRLGAVTIGYSRDQIADVTFHFNSVLDVEHGVEVTTNQTDIEDEFSGVYPFDLPSDVDPTTVDSEPAGHRLVEFKYQGKWRGIYVLDESMQCAGFVASSFTMRSYRNQVSDPAQIEGIRAATRWHRWLASPAKIRVSSWLATSNWFISLPCLLIAWALYPQLFWVSIVLSVGCIVGAWLLSDEFRLLPYVQVGAAIAGLVYASSSQDFGSNEHVTEVVGVYRSIVWWGAVLIDALAFAVLISLVVGFNRLVIRDGLGAVLPALLSVTVLTSGLAASHYGYWSAFHLVWLTPVTIAASFVLLFVGVVTDIFEFGKPCPECGEPLATRKAQQCLHCGANWH